MTHTSKTNKTFNKQKRDEEPSVDHDIVPAIDQMRLPELYNTKKIYEKSLLDYSLKALRAKDVEEKALYKQFKKKTANNMSKIQAEIDKLNE